MTDAYTFTGRILPERKTFNLEGQRLYVRDDQRGLDAWLIFGAMDNQLVGRLIGKIGHLSNFALKMIVDQATKDIINAVAFTTGRLYQVDLVGVVKEGGDRADGSMAFHYFDNCDEVVAERTVGVTIQEVASLFTTEEGVPVRRCLNDLRMALTDHMDSPYYCYRALETIRGHFGAKHREGKDNKQWEIMRKVLTIERTQIDKIKRYADPLRHGTSVSFTGAEWREIISITWEIVEGYIKFLLKEQSSKRA